MIPQRQSGERFWMLETIREFALGRLREHDTFDEVRRRCAEYFLAGAEANYGEIFESLTHSIALRRVARGLRLGSPPGVS